MITAILSNSTTSVTLPFLSPPLEEDVLENSKDVVTLDYNVHTRFINYKRAWKISLDVLTEDQYDDIKAIYLSQFTLFEYPVLEIDHYLIDTPVRMKINTKQVFNNCGSIENVELTFRETSQLPIVSS